jgi:hypothetical protein
VKTGFKLVAGLLVLLLAPGFASAQLSMANTRPLAFGRFIAGAGGTVKVAPGAARTSVGVLLLPSEAGPAQFVLHDTNPDNASNAVLLTLPGNGDVVLKSDANSMVLTGFSSDLPSAPRLTAGRITFAIGATLDVALNQPRGNYSGSISITVEYQ